MILKTGVKLSSIIFLCIFCPTSLAENLLAVVVFNGEKLTGHFNNATLLKSSFEKIPSISKTNNSLKFVFFDLNSTVCDYRKFLSFFAHERDVRQFALVVVIESCSCERQLSRFFDQLGVKIISSCEEPVILTVKGSLAVLLHTEQNRKHFLFVPRDPHGLEFYQRLSCHLSLDDKIQISKTIWLSKKEDLTNEELRGAFRSLSHNGILYSKTPEATFIIALSNTSYGLVKNVMNVARMELNKTYDKILWIFPRLNSYTEISSLFSMKENAQVLTFKESFTPNSREEGGCDDHDQAVRAVVTKTNHFIQRNWENKEKYEELLNVGVTERCSLSNAEFDIYERNTIDVLKMERQDLFEEITWKRISTWNGESLQQCCNEASQATLAPTQAAHVIRVPIVEYFPFVVKHEFNKGFGKCHHSSRVCYELKRQANNDTIINRDNVFCCSGLSINIIIYLNNAIPNYLFELYFQEEKLYGAYNNDSGTWNGIVADILNGKGDLGIDLTLSAQRCIHLGCSLGYLLEGFDVLTKVPVKNIGKKDSFSSLLGNFRLFLTPFNNILSITILMLVNFFLVLIWGADKICLYYRNKRTGRNDKFTLLDSTSYVWATAFSRDVGDSKKPLTLTARYLSSWLAFFALIFTNIYVAKLMVEIVKNEPVKAFKSLKDPKVLGNEVKVGVVASSSHEAFFHNTRDNVLKQSYENNIKNNLMPTLEVGIKAVKNGSLQGLIADTLSLRIAILRDPNCLYSLLDKEFSMLPIGFAFRKNWTLAKEIKLAELEMNGYNITGNHLKKHLNSHSCLSSEVHSEPFTIADISGLFIILLFGIAYCMFCLIMENLFSLLVYWYRNSSMKWNVSEDNINQKKTHQL